MKTIPLLVSFLLMVPISQAQVRLGANVGPTLGTFTEPENLVPGARWLYTFGFHGGLAGDIRLTEVALLAVQINYFQKGMKSEVPFGPSPSYSIVTNGFVDVAVFFRYSFPGPFIPWYLEAGPTIGRLVSSSTLFDDPILGAQRLSTLDAYKTIDATIALGLGSEYELSPSLTLTYAIHYNHGFMRVFRFTGLTKTRTFQLSVGILYAP